MVSKGLLVVQVLRNLFSSSSVSGKMKPLSSESLIWSQNTIHKTPGTLEPGHSKSFCFQQGSLSLRKTAYAGTVLTAHGSKMLNAKRSRVFLYTADGRNRWYPA